MISRDYVNKYFSNEENILALKVYDKYRLANERDISIFTNSFLPPNIWMFFYEKLNDEFCKVETNGCFKECERRVISFNNSYNEAYPIVLLKVESNSSFNKLTHRDFLGAILSLGIEREKIGDIVIKDNSAFVPVMEDIWSYVYDNITSVGKTPVNVSIVNDLSGVPLVEFKEDVINVSSLRIDNFICKIANV
ncbi:MAG: YlmH/Sll1252 family protein [Clostridium sp.]